MDLEELRLRLFRVVDEGYTHENYQRTVDLARFARQTMTGKNQDEIIIQYVLKESTELLQQRLRLSNPITPVIGNQVQSVYKRLPRVDGVKTEIVMEEEGEKLEKVKASLGSYYGEMSFEEYIDAKQSHYEFIDANAWLVYEFKPIPDGDGGVGGFNFYPFEVSSDQAVDFETKHGDTEYLIVKHTEKKEEKEESTVPKDVLDVAKESHKIGSSEKMLDKYYAYGIGATIKWEEIEEYMVLTEEEESMGLGIVEVKGRFFLEKIYLNKLTEFPAMRWGSIMDACTDGQTRVTPLEPAEGTIRDVINEKSRLDLTKAEHTFLQKYVYADPCEYEDEKSGNACEGGRLGGFDEIPCPNCKGHGYNFHTSVQEVVAIQMPDGDENHPKLSEMAHYVTLPIETPKFQSEELDKAMRRVYAAVFSLEVHDAPTFSDTATASLLDSEKINDVLAPFAKQNCLLVEKGIRIAFQHYEAINYSAHKSIPKDLKLKGVRELIVEFKAAKEAGLSSAVLGGIENDLISKQYQNDPVEVLKFIVKKKHVPWGNKTIDEKRMIIGNRAPDDRDRVLYENETRIFCEIEEEDPRFYSKTYKMQSDVINKKIAELIEEIAGSQPEPIISLSNGEEEE